MVFSNIDQYTIDGREQRFPNFARGQLFVPEWAITYPDIRKGKCVRVPEADQPESDLPETDLQLNSEGEN